MRKSLGLLPFALLAMPATGNAAGDAAKGKPLFVAQCASCHGRTGDGNGPAGRALNPPPKAFTKGGLPADEKMANVIQKGGKANGLSKDMDAYPGLSDQQVLDIIAYIKTLAK